MDMSFKRVIATTFFPKHSGFLDKLNRTPLFAEFVKENRNVTSFDTREEMFDDLMTKYPGAIDYLEFGVFQGRSIFYWADKNKETATRFTGFDTFTGLPEDWDYHKKGAFNVDGNAPVTQDSRIKFVKGLFQDTLPGFLKDFSRQNRIVIHNDSDLYSSSLYLLTRLNDVIVPGTIIIFDEFGNVQHEFRAFFDYISAYRRSFKVVSASYQYYTAAVEML
jgi:O-methyltransferase